MKTKIFLWVALIIISVSVVVFFWLNSHENSNNDLDKKEEIAQTKNDVSQNTRFQICAQTIYDRYNEFMSTAWASIVDVDFQREEDLWYWWTEFGTVTYQKAWIDRESTIYCFLTDDYEVKRYQISPYKFEDERFFNEEWRKAICNEDINKLLQDDVNLNIAYHNEESNAFRFTWDIIVEEWSESNLIFSCYFDAVYWGVVVNVEDQDWNIIANQDFPQHASLLEHCEIYKWTVEIRDGNEYCLFRDSSFCELNSFYENECQEWVNYWEN